MKTSSTKVIPLGGLEEFGSNSLLFEYANHNILVDFGLKFVRQPSLGIDYSIPDLRYLRNNAAKLRGILITHGHLDHIGGIAYLIKEFKIPIYASKFTAMLVHQLLEAAQLRDYKLTILQPGKKYDLTPFMVEALYIDHSIPDALALVITTPTGIIIHSGDFKSDRDPFKRKRNRLEAFDAYRQKNILALFSDSTNAVRSGHVVSEMVVYKNLEKIFKQHKQRLIFSTFSSQINRIRKILDLALKYNRVVFFVGKAMLTNLNHAIKGQFLSRYEQIIKPLKNYQSYPAHRSVIIATGSQGEERSAMIKLANKEHRNLRLNHNDVIIFSSSIIPGNEVAVDELINLLVKNGHKIITNDDLPIHASGHGHAEELSLLLTKVKPKFFFPVHGNYINLKKHKELAIATGMDKAAIFLLENGQRLEIFTERVKLLEKVRLTKLYIEAGDISTADENTFTQRKQMSEHGIIFLTAVIRGDQLVTLSVKMAGVLGSREEEQLAAALTAHYQQLFAAREVRVELKLHKKVEKFFHSETKRFLQQKVGFAPLTRVCLISK